MDEGNVAGYQVALRDHNLLLVIINFKWTAQMCFLQLQ